jgi:phage terminase large subunit
MIKQIVKSHEPVFCDSAEPDRIKDLQRAGIKAIAANKNVKEGIDFIKSRKLYVHTQSANALKEIKSYKFATKQEGITEVPLKLNDHAMDAGRYGSIHFKKAKTGLNMTFSNKR